MKNLIKFLLIVIVVIGCKTKEKSIEISEYDLAITNVTLIDGTGAEAQKNTTILIKDGRIISISGNDQAVKADSIIDGSEKYLIPGLFDNHFHLPKNLPKQFQRMIHFGVTNVFIPGSRNMTYPIIREYDSLIKNNIIVGPKLRWSSLFVTVPNGHPRGDDRIDGESIHRLTSIDEIPGIVSRAKKNGAIAMKVMIEDGPLPPLIERINPKWVTKIREEAKMAGMMLFLHISDSEELRLAVDYNPDAIMHFVGPYFNWEQDQDLIPKMKEKDIYWVTTGMLFMSYTTYPFHSEWLETEHWSLYAEEKEHLKSEQQMHQQIASSIITRAFDSSVENFMTTIPPFLKDIKKMDSLGVNIVLGTDTGTPNQYNVAGLNVHEEMRFLQEGGMDPIRIIKCATINAAKMLKVDKEYGSIEVGKIADMVLLDKNPLDDIVNTLSINTVFKKGKVQPRIQIK